MRETIRTLVLALLLAAVLCGRRSLDLNKTLQQKLDYLSTSELSVAVSAAPTNSRLFVRVESSTDDFLALPVVSLSKGERYYECDDQSPVVLCMVPSEELQANDRFDVNVNCLTECNYSIVAYVDRYYRLKLGEAVSLIMEKDRQQFQATVDVDVDDFSEIRILATLYNPEDVNGALAIYGNSGNSPEPPTSTTAKYVGRPIWNDGMGLFISRENIQSKQSVKVLVEGKKDMEIVLECYAVKDNKRNVSIEQDVYDEVRKNQTLLYMLDLSSLTPDELSGSIYVKLTTYTGRAGILMAPDESFSVAKTTKGDTFRGITQVTLTKKLRQEMGYKDKAVIGIFGYFDSTYLLQANVDRRGFTILDNDVADVSTVEGDDVDNYIYVLQAIASNDKSDNVRNFSIGAEVYTEDLEYGVRICKESNGWENCLLKKVGDVMAVQDTFNEISGTTHENNAVKYFSFSYDITKCRSTGSDRYSCGFQVVAFNPNKSTKPMTYMIDFAEEGVETNLLEGVPKKDRVAEGTVKKYLLPLSDVNDISEVHIFLTIISGDALLYVSKDRRDHNMTDPEVDVAMNDSLIYKQNITNAYYIRVQAYSHSYYSLTAIIKRKSGDSTSNNSTLQDNAILLTQGPSQLSFINSAQKKQVFHFQLRKTGAFSVDVSNIKGLVDFEVFPRKGDDRLTSHSWKSDGDCHIDISDVDSFTSTNEFTIVVTSEGDSVFEISYNAVGKCPIRSFGRVVNLDVDPDSDRCSSYSIGRMKDLEIVIASSYFDMTAGNMNVTVDWNGENKRQLSQRVTLLQGSEVSSMCPVGQKGNKKSPDCILTIRFHSFKPITVTSAVQYLDDELELFDGIQQYVKGEISPSKGRYFLYNMVSDKPLMVALRTQSDNKYKIVGKLTSWKDYLNSTGTALYPSFSEDNISTETTSLGSTGLVLHKSQLAAAPAKQLLLLSVFASTGNSEGYAEFRIEVVQHVTKLQPSETKQAFVSKEESLMYEVYSDGSKELIVHANSYTAYCLKMSLFAKVNGAINATALTKTLTGELMISPSEKPTNYVVEVTGTNDCAFELSYSTIDEKIYELVRGHMFSTELKQNEKIYFLYYNTRRESFRVVSQSDYGQVEFNAKTITNDQVASISQTIANINGRWEFGGPSHNASLLVQDSSEYFCVNCYYLIQVTSASSASFILVLHSTTSPIPMRENRVTRETLISMQPRITYAFLKLVPFKLGITVLFGEPSVEVTLTTDKNFKVSEHLNSSATIDVPYNGSESTSDNLYDDEAFLIEVKCPSSCSYTLTIDASNYPRKIIEGMPYTVEVTNATTGACIQFLSMEKNSSTYLHMSTNNTNNIKYDIRCFNKDSWQECEHSDKIVLKTDRNREDVNVQLKSLRGYYLICFNVLNEKEPQNVTVLHSYNVNLRYVMAYSDNLISNSVEQPPVMIEMYNPSHESVLVEVFECSGQVEFEATSEYKKFLENNSSIAEHSKTAGHYVVKLDTADVPYSMMFSRIRVKNTRYSPNASFLFRYSFFRPDQYPYSALGPDSTHISYQYINDKIQFKIDHVKASSAYNVVSYKYLLFASNNPAFIKAATQCGTASIYTNSIMMSTNEANSVSEVTFEMSREEAEAIVSSETGYLYISANCWVEVVDSETDEPGSRGYRFIYDTVQMTLAIPSHSMANFKMKVKFFFLWVVFPVLISGILLFFSVKYCLGKVRQLPHSELIEQEPQEEVNYTQNPQGVTAKHLVGTSVDMSARPKPEEV